MEIYIRDYGDKEEGHQWRQEDCGGFLLGSDISDES